MLKFHAWVHMFFLVQKIQEFRGASLRADVGELQRNMNHLEQVVGPRQIVSMLDDSTMFPTEKMMRCSMNNEVRGKH